MHSCACDFTQIHTECCLGHPPLPTRAKYLGSISSGLVITNYEGDNSKRVNFDDPWMIPVISPQLA